MPAPAVAAAVAETVTLASEPPTAETYLAETQKPEEVKDLPTYVWPNKGQLESLSPPTAALLEQASFFQKYHPVPDFETPWQREDLFVYRLRDGGGARFVRDQGVAFEAHPKGQAAQVLERRIEGVAEAALPGSAATRSSAACCSLPWP